MMLSYLLDQWNVVCPELSSSLSEGQYNFDHNKGIVFSLCTWCSNVLSEGFVLRDLGSKNFHGLKTKG